MSATLRANRQTFRCFHDFQHVRVIADAIKIEEGGRLRHIFFDTGRDQLIAFFGTTGVPGVPAEYDAGINRGLGVPTGLRHFAFEAGSQAALVEKRNELRAKSVEVTDIVDHDSSKSVYFKDPNGLSLAAAPCVTSPRRCDDAGGFHDALNNSDTNAVMRPRRGR